MTIREDISNAAKSVLSVLAHRFEETWDPSPVLVATRSAQERASLQFLCNLGLTIDGCLAFSKVDYVFKQGVLSPVSQDLETSLDLSTLVAVGLAPSVQARIVQEGVERYLNGVYQLNVRYAPEIQSPGPFNVTDVVAPVSLDMIDEMLENAPSGEILLSNTLCYADLRKFGRDKLELVSDTELLKRGIQATYRNLIIKTSRSCKPDEVLLLDGRGTLVGSFRVTRY